MVTNKEQSSASGQHWLAEMLEIPNRPAPQPKNEIVVGILKRHLSWVSQNTTRRAIGCSIIMLPETDAALDEEIADYHRTGQVARCARRLNNPMDKRETPLNMPGLQMTLENNARRRF